MESSLQRLSLSNRPPLVASTSSAPVLHTNVYRLVTEDKMVVYKYSVLIEKRVITNKNETLKLPLTKHGGADAIRLMRSRVCRATIRSLSSTAALADALLLYDGFDVLYSNKELAVVNKEVHVDSIQISDKDRLLVVKNAVALLVTIKFDSGLTNFESTIKDCEREDPMLFHFYSALLRSGADQERFIFYRGGKMYDWEKVQDIGKGYLRAPGIHLGLKCVGEGREELTVALDVDATEGVFFKDQSLLASSCAYLGQSEQQLRSKFGEEFAMKKLEKYVRDMVLCTDDHRLLTASGLKWKEVEVKEGEKRRWMLQEWSEWCKDEPKRSKYQGWPIVYEESLKGEGNAQQLTQYYLPFPTLTLLPHSRVPMRKQDCVKKPPIIPPAQRSQKIDEARRAINLHFNNDKLQGYKTHISSDPVVVPYRRLDAPEVYGRDKRGNATKLLVKPDKHSFDSNQCSFVDAACIDMLLVAYDSVAFGRRKNEAEWFGSRFVEVCNSKGMGIADMRMTGVGDMAALVEQFRGFDEWRRSEREKRGGRMPRVMMLILGCSEAHDDIKRLEHQWRLVTQRVEQKTVHRVFEKKSLNDFTMHNIVKKANEKSGGTNVAVRGPMECANLFPLFEDAASPASLIVGLDVCHGEPLSRYQELRGFKAEPSTIGISSNAATGNPQQFSGCYLPTMTRKEAVPTEVMRGEGRKLIGKYLKNHGRLPTSVIYYRDGVARNQYDDVLSEFDAFMEGIREALNVRDAANKENNLVSPSSSSSFAPREIVVVCTKEHHLRLFDKSVKPLRNPLPGSIVDSGIVSPFFPEFLLVSADVFCGSAKGALTTILRDGGKKMREYPPETLREMQLLTHSLTFLHGVTDAPTGLPDPICAAHDLAKRGHNVAKAMRHAYGDEAYNWTLERLAEELNIENTALDGVKFNA